MYWSCCQLQPNRHRLALHLLAQAGYETYAPVIANDRLVRGRIVNTGPQLLFGRYIFVWIVAQWHAINSTPGVARLVSDGSSPAVVPERIISELRAREDEMGLIQLPQRPAPAGLHHGDAVRVVDGVFFGLTGLYVGQAPHERIKVLLTWLGAEREMELPAANVEPLRRQRGRPRRIGRAPGHR